MDARRDKGLPAGSEPKAEPYRFSDDRHQTYFDQTPLAITVIDAVGHYVEVNPAACALTGYDEAELLAMSLTDLVAEVSRRAGPPFLASVKEAGRVTGEFPMTCKDGSLRWVTCDAVRLSDERFLLVNSDVTARKLAEDALRHSEERYRSLVELSPDAIFINRNNRVVLVNSAAIELFGATDAQDLLGRSPFELFDPEYHGLMRERIRGVLAGHVAPLIKGKILRLDGGIRFAEITAAPLLDSDGKAIQVILRDITAREKAEAELRESEERLRLALVGAKGGVWDWDLLTGEAWWSSEMYELWGVAPGTPMLLENTLQMVHPEDHQRLKVALDASLAQDSMYQCEFRICHPTCGDRWMASLGRTQRDAAGKLIRMAGITLDITERKQLERALSEESDRNAVFFEQSPDGIVIIDPATLRIVTFNTTAHQQLGYSRDEFAALSILDVEAKETADESFAQVSRVLQDGKADFESLHRTKAGEIRNVHVTAQIVNVRGCPTYFCVWRDVTLKKQVEESLRVAKNAAEAANRAKSEFLANMSHELRTPMTAIMGFADLLAMSPDLSPAEQQDFLDAIQRNSQALLHLIDDVLDLSQVEAGRLSLENADCSLRDLLEDVLSAVQTQAKEKGLSLNVDYQLPLPATIHTDRVRLRQVLVNLVGNAVKFTEVGGVRISVRCLQDEMSFGRVQFSVADTGIGIPSDKLNDIFQPFVQLDGSLTRRYGGTGLGLGISQRLASALGGSIEVKSQVGQGSTFTLTIAAGFKETSHASELPHEKRATVPLTARRESVSRGRVLFAEDFTYAQDLIRYHLNHLGLEVDIVDDGEKACEMVTRMLADGRPYDLILMDIQMPVMDGYEATRRLRQFGWRGPIVALTAFAMVGDRERCLAAGCDDYLTKPVTQNALQDVISRYLPTSSSLEAV